MIRRLIQTRLAPLGRCGLALAVACVGCSDPADEDVCEGVTCSGHGNCVENQSGDASCVCDLGYEGAVCNSCANGYHPDGLGGCVPDEPCPTGCLIGSTCYNDGDPNPQNGCEVCDVSAATEAWTDNDGVICDDGVLCNGDDSCQGGSCSVHGGGDPPCPDDGLYCNGVESCDATTDQCVHTAVPCGAPDTPKVTT